MKYIEVALNLPLQKSFQYRVPTELATRVTIGSRVLVPFRNQRIKGFVAREKKRPGQGKLKDVIKSVDDFPAMSPALLRLGEWMSEYYHCSLGQSLHSMLPIQRSLKNEEAKAGARKISSPLSLPPEVSCFGGLAPTSKGSVSLFRAEEPKERISIFLSLAKDVLAQGRQVVLIVPEVSYIASWRTLIESRYGNCVAILHSRLKDRERYVSWMRMRKGEVHFAIGTRSLLFAPFPDLGLIAVEEEENTAYKQREVPRYHAREVAARRGEIEGFPVVLMSGSPSLESWSRADKKEYLSMPTGAARKAHPEVEIIDLREEGRILSRPLEEAVKEALKRDELAILFLDRRGFSRYLFCQECGEILRCPNCNTGLTFHLRGTLLCHYCGHEEGSPLMCPHCHGNRLRGMGVGTQQVEKEAKTRFPEALIRRADLDVSSSRACSPLKDDVIEGRVDILIGTKLVMKEEILKEAKVVGIVLADDLLNLPDFRAGERLFQLLVKIKGCMKKEGKMLIQTYNPAHHSLRCVRDGEEGFYREEMRAREELHFPPHVHWARVLLEGAAEAKVREMGERISQKVDEKGVKFLGPSPCPLAKTRGRYRYQLIVRDENPSRITASLKGEVGYASSSTNAVRVSVDVDPQELM